MRALLLTWGLLSVLHPEFSQHACTGKPDCRVCTNCSSCRHCAKLGGTCGVCAGAKKRTPRVTFLLPVDEAAKDPSFLAFRTNLLAAVKKNDLTAILARISPGIQNGFGGNDGKAQFKQLWVKNEPDFRGELVQVLTHGGSWGKDQDTGAREFAAPYYSSCFPAPESEDEIGITGEVVVLGSEVKLFARPSPQAAVIGTLRYSIVSPAEGESTETAWIKVTAPSGKTGYIRRVDVGSPSGYRAYFQKVKGQWQMTAFVAGD